MVRIHRLSLIALFLLPFANGSDVAAQAWKHIVPLTSTCKDVKKLLDLEECSSHLVYETPQYDLAVRFAVRDGKRVSPRNKVKSILVIFHDLLKLSDYATDFDGYEISREPDAPEIAIYRNNKRGVRLTVQTAVANEPYISSLFIFAPRNVQKK